MDLIDQLNDPGRKIRTLFFEHQGNRAVRAGRLKLVAFDDEPWELYDFNVDRTELDDLAAKHPDRVKELDAGGMTLTRVARFGRKVLQADGSKKRSECAGLSSFCYSESLAFLCCCGSCCALR